MASEQRTRTSPVVLRRIARLSMLLIAGWAASTTSVAAGDSHEVSPATDGDATAAPTWNPWNKESPEPFGYDVLTAPDLPLGYVDPGDPPATLPLDAARRAWLANSRRAILDVTTAIDRTAYSWYGRAVVTATVQQSGFPVVDCDSVVVVSAANPRVRARLADTGASPDLLAGDGIYTGHFDVGADVGEARPTGTYVATATAYRGLDIGADDSPSFSLFSVRRWTGITTGGGSDTGDSYTNFIATPQGDGYHHQIDALGLIRSTSVTNAQIRIPIFPPENLATNLVVTGAGVSNVQLRDNVIEFDCDLSSSTVTRVDIAFDAPSDLAFTRIDRYQTGDIGLRNFRNGYLVWNQFIHTAIFGSGFSTPHGPGCIADLQVTDQTTGDAHTVDCMERVAVHIDNAAHNDGTGTYPGNIKWTGDALDWLESADLQELRFRFTSGGLYGLSDRLSISREVTFFAGERYFHHDYEIRNIDLVPHDCDFVWGREQWLYGSAPGSDRQQHDRGLLPNDLGSYGGELRFTSTQVDGPWFAAYDLSSNYAIAVLLEGEEAQVMPTYVHFSCNPPLGANSVEYPIVPAGSCTNMENLFFERSLGTLAPGEVAYYDFYQWGGYGQTREGLTDLLWLDADEVSVPVTAVEGPEDASTGNRFALRADPNPFHGQISVSFDMPARGRATLQAFDASGRRVGVLLDGIVSPGPQAVTWRLDAGASGVYWLSLDTPLGRTSKQVVARR